MNMDDIIVLVINERIAGKAVCLVVNKLSDLRDSTKVVLTQYGVSFVGASDKVKAGYKDESPDYYRVSWMHFDEIYCCNVDMKRRAAQYMVSKLKGEITAIHFYYGIKSNLQLVTSTL